MKKIKLLSTTLLATLLLAACSPSLKPKEDKKAEQTTTSSKEKEAASLEKKKTNKKNSLTKDKEKMAKSSNDDQKKKSKKEAAKDKNTKKEKRKKEPKQLPKPEGIQAEKVYKTAWNNNWNGLDTNIDEVSVVKMDPEVMAESGIEGQGLVGVKFSLNNKSDIPLDVYPDQSQLNINGQVVEANMLASDQIGGQLQPGETKEGFVIYNLPELEAIEDLTNFSVEWRASHDDDLIDDQETAFDNIYETGNDSSYQEFTANIQLK